MNKFSTVVAALAVAGMAGAVYGAQSAQPANFYERAAKVMGPSLQSAGAHPNEPGTSNDPVSAEKAGTPAGGGVKAAGPHPEEPGISGDPVSAEKAGKATGGPVSITPGADAERNPNPAKTQ